MTVTHLEEGFLDRVPTTSGLTVGALSNKHKVLLLFLRHTNCVFCKESIELIADNYGNLIKYNTIPVLVHMESPKYFAKFLKDFAGENQIIGNMVSAHDEYNYISKAFSVIDEASPVKHLPTMVYRALTSKYLGQTSPFAPEGLSNHRIPAVFVIENGKVINEFRYAHQGDRADFLRVLINPNGVDKSTGITLVKRSELVCDNLFCDIPPPRSAFVPGTPEMRNKKSLVCTPTKTERSNDQADALERILKEERVECLQDLLDSPFKLRFFHLFAAQQFCAENVIFWSVLKPLFLEQVNLKYRVNNSEAERRKIGKNICDVFFDPESLLEINVKERSKNYIRQHLEQNAADVELFDMITKELEDQVLAHLFCSFVESDLYLEMKNVK
ncbi:hypothetical protein AKO1_012239 [Acrasis kona]|uniref:RGS domain-containing protein n=1 Tax=Acrasis kona TaxID=1008807 RepID=A0AAW2Z872_9EUKA